MVATTTLYSPTMSIWVLGARTDDAGNAVSDVASGEEGRILATAIWGSSGKVTADSFRVRAQAAPNMTVRVGSGSAELDHYILLGQGGTGQGAHVIRLTAATTNVTIEGASAADRTDEVYLIVENNSYDGSGRILPRLAVRKGDSGGGVPGPDAAWTAYVLLASVAVDSAATTITTADITDGRDYAGLRAGPLRSPYLLCERTANATINDDTPTVIGASVSTTAEYDPESVLSRSGGAVTVGRACVAKVEARAEWETWAGASTDTVMVEVLVNGVEVTVPVRDVRAGDPSSTGGAVHGVAATIAIASGDVVSWQVEQVSGSSRQLNGTALAVTIIG